MAEVRTLVTADHFKRKHFRSIEEWQIYRTLFPQWVASWTTVICNPDRKIKVQAVIF